MFYIGDDIQIVMTVNEDLTGSTINVCYKKPGDATTYTVPPSIVDIGTSKVTYNLLKAVNNTVGEWKFWVRVLNDDQMEASSTEVKLKVQTH